ncbi:MAG: hypothetical protein E7491_03020 [Ruminococcaceae bacterium]|nr:hypothetical protein [Oscillospiraceae bacterium]
MKKYAALLLAVMLAITFAGCANRGITRNVKREIGESDEYSRLEIISAMSTVETHFRMFFEGCELKTLRYDEALSKEESKEWAQQYNSEEAIILYSDFYVTPSGGDGSLNTDYTYKNWNWILTKDSLGIWVLQTWGY